MLRALIVLENWHFPFDQRVRRQALALQGSGYEVSVIAPQGDGQPLQEVYKGIHVYRYRQSFASAGIRGYLQEYSKAIFSTAVLSWRIHRSSGFDIIQYCNPPDLFFPQAFFWRALRKVVIFDQHDPGPEMVRGRLSGIAEVLAFRFFAWAERVTYASAQIVVASNDSFKRRAIAKGRKPASLVFVSRNGPELASLNKAVVNPALLRGAKHLISYLGVVGPADGLDLFIDSVQCLVRDIGRTDTRFVLMGKGSELPKLKRIVEERGLSEYVEFPGYLSEEQYLPYLASSDICVCPDPDSPSNRLSTMVKLMDYMAVGKPSVCFDLPENRASAGESARYVAPNSTREFALALHRLLDEPEERSRMGALGNRRVREHLSWDQQKLAFLAAYQAASRYLAN